MLVETRYEHVVLDEQGTSTIVGTTMEVKELVATPSRSAFGSVLWMFSRPKRMSTGRQTTRFYSIGLQN